MQSERVLCLLFPPPNPLLGVGVGFTSGLVLRSLLGLGLLSWSGFVPLLCLLFPPTQLTSVFRNPILVHSSELELVCAILERANLLLFSATQFWSTLRSWSWFALSRSGFVLTSLLGLGLLPKRGMIHGALVAVAALCFSQALS